MSRILPVITLIGFLSLVGCGPLQYAFTPETEERVDPQTGQTELVVTGDSPAQEATDVFSPLAGPWGEVLSGAVALAGTAFLVYKRQKRAQEKRDEALAEKVKDKLNGNGSGKSAS